MTLDEKWGVGLAAAQDNLKAGITGEHKALMCPYKLGPCWEHGCEMWVGSAGCCGLVFPAKKDVVLANLMAGIGESNGRADEAELAAADRLTRIEELESELASRPTQEKYAELEADMRTTIIQLRGKEEECADARQELETLRAQGGRKSRRKAESVER